MNLTQAVLIALAARTSEWIYDITRPLPHFKQVHGCKIRLEYKHRESMKPDERHPARAESMVVTWKPGDGCPEQTPQRIFLVAIRGSETLRDWLANLGVIPNEDFRAQGLEVHSGWSAIINRLDYLNRLREALREEMRSGGLDAVLLTGQSGRRTGTDRSHDGVQRGPQS